MGNTSLEKYRTNKEAQIFTFLHFIKAQIINGNLVCYFDNDFNTERIKTGPCKNTGKSICIYNLRDQDSDLKCFALKFQTTLHIINKYVPVLSLRNIRIWLPSKGLLNETILFGCQRPQKFPFKHERLETMPFSVSSVDLLTIFLLEIPECFLPVVEGSRGHHRFSLFQETLPYTLSFLFLSERCTEWRLHLLGTNPP